MLREPYQVWARPFPLPHPFPRSSPFSIGRPRWFLPSASRLDKPPPRSPPQHPLRPNRPHNPRTRTHPKAAFTTCFVISPIDGHRSAYRSVGTVVDEEPRPQDVQNQQPNHWQHRHARTCDAFLLHATQPSRGSVRHARFALQTTLPLSTGTPHELGIAHRLCNAA